MSDERRDRSELRDKLAEIDREILERLDARARVSSGLAGRAGAEPSADVGEREWVEALVRAGSGDMPPASVRAIFGQIRAAARSIEQPVAIAYVGPEGSFCHEAALAHFGGARVVATPGIAEALEEVVRGRAGFAVFPFESSVDGLVQPSVTALADTDLMLVGERVVSASYDLMSKLPELGTVEHVYATALGQAACQRFLDAELPRASVIDVRSPHVAAELARDEPNAAAIVPERVGRAATLETLRANIGDEPELKLRYGIASARPAMRSGNDITCLLFSVDDAPGSLFGVLRHFAERGVNLQKLQSRPVTHGSWDYVFYVELGAHVTERPVTTALEAIKRSAKYLKVLGSFPTAAG